MVRYFLKAKSLFPKVSYLNLVPSHKDKIDGIFNESAFLLKADTCQKLSGHNAKSGRQNRSNVGVLLSPMLPN